MEALLYTDLHLALLVRHAQPVVGLVLPDVGCQQSGAAVGITGIVSLNIQCSHHTSCPYYNVKLS